MGNHHQSVVLHVSSQMKLGERAINPILCLHITPSSQPDGGLRHEEDHSTHSISYIQSLHWAFFTLQRGTLPRLHLEPTSQNHEGANPPCHPTISPVSSLSLIMGNQTINITHHSSLELRTSSSSQQTGTNHNHLRVGSNEGRASASSQIQP